MQVKQFQTFTTQSQEVPHLTFNLQANVQQSNNTSIGQDNVIT